MATLCEQDDNLLTKEKWKISFFNSPIKTLNMTNIELKLNQLRNKMAEMLMQPSYSPEEFNKLLEEYNKLADSLAPVQE